MLKNISLENFSCFENLSSFIQQPREPEMVTAYNRWACRTFQTFVSSFLIQSICLAIHRQIHETVIFVICNLHLIAASCALTWRLTWRALLPLETTSMNRLFMSDHCHPQHSQCGQPLSFKQLGQCQCHPQNQSYGRPRPQTGWSYLVIVIKATKNNGDHFP